MALLDETLSLLITDVELGGRSGLDLLAAARALCPALPVVCISANVTRLGQASRAGADAVLAKPFLLEELRLVVALLTIGAHT